MVLKDLLWVAADPAGQTPKEARTQIRKQVMKAAMENKRRKRKDSGAATMTNANTDARRQQEEQHHQPREVVPTFVRGKLVLRLANRGRPTRQRGGRNNDDVPAQLPLTGIEKLVSKHGLDRHAAAQVFGIVSFETLCSHFLNAHPEMLPQLVIEREEHANDYFGHVVRYYGHIACLDDAMRAVVAQVQANLCPESAPSDREILIKYGKALRSLQEAINSASWAGPEVLCATQLLALFEVLQSRGLERWRGHIQGAEKLMRLRGPGKHRTTFDVNLFLNLYPAICCEDFMKCQPCVFTEPEWQEFIVDIMDHDDPFSERGRLNMKSASLLFRAVNGIPVLLPLLVQAAEPDDPRVLEAAENTYEVVQGCVAWFDDFNASVRRLAAKTDDWSSHPRLRITYTMGCMVHMVHTRMAATIMPSERARLERIAQMRAAEVMQLVASVPAEEHREKLLLRQEKNLALGTLLTSKDFEEHNDSGKLLDVNAFLKWCQIISDSAHTEFGDLTADGAFIRFSSREMARLVSGQPGFANEDAQPVVAPDLPDKFNYWAWADDGDGDGA